MTRFVTISMLANLLFGCSAGAGGNNGLNPNDFPYLPQGNEPGSTLVLGPCFDPDGVRCIDNTPSPSPSLNPILDMSTPELPDMSSCPLPSPSPSPSPEGCDHDNGHHYGEFKDGHHDNGRHYGEYKCHKGESNE